MKTENDPTGGPMKTENDPPPLVIPNLGSMTDKQLEGLADTLNTLQLICSAMRRGIASAQIGWHKRSNEEFNLARSLRDRLPEDIQRGVSCVL